MRRNSVLFKGKDEDHAEEEPVIDLRLEPTRSIRA